MVGYEQHVEPSLARRGEARDPEVLLRRAPCRSSRRRAPRSPGETTRRRSGLSASTRSRLSGSADARASVSVGAGAVAALATVVPAVYCAVRLVSVSRCRPPAADSRLIPSAGTSDSEAVGRESAATPATAVAPATPFSRIRRPSHTLSSAASASIRRGPPAAATGEGRSANRSPSVEVPAGRCSR